MCVSEVVLKRSVSFGGADESKSWVLLSFLFCQSDDDGFCQSEHSVFCQSDDDGFRFCCKHGDLIEGFQLLNLDSGGHIENLDGPRTT